jgi:hypothetical protein
MCRSKKHHQKRRYEHEFLVVRARLEINTGACVMIASQRKLNVKEKRKN